MLSEEQMKAGYIGIRTSTIKTLIPTPEELAAREPHVVVIETPHGIKFIRTPEDQFSKSASIEILWLGKKHRCF